MQRAPARLSRDDQIAVTTRPEAEHPASRCSGTVIAINDNGASGDCNRRGGGIGLGSSTVVNSETAAIAKTVSRNISELVGQTNDASRPQRPRGSAPPACRLFRGRDESGSWYDGGDLTIHPEA